MKKGFGIGCGGMVLLAGCLIVAVIAVNLSGGNETAVQGASTSGAAGKVTAAAPARYALNQPATVKHWRIAVTQAQTRGKELVWSEFGNTATAAGTWYIVTVTMTNTGNENFGVNTWDFELHDGAGATYKVSDATGAYAYSEFRGGQSMGGQVPPGVAVTYYLVFDINPNARGLHLVFKQDTRPDFTLE